MKTSDLGLSWVDFVVAILLIAGVWRGRKRGMSEELLDMLKWAVVVVAAGLLYEPAGQLLASMSVFSLLSCYVTAYITIALMVLLFFGFIKQRAGGKLIGSDVFGNGEYYLGMVGGSLRYACVILVGMAFLHARSFNQSAITSWTTYQQENFGSSFFFSLPEVQSEVFTKSYSGRFAQNFLQVVLIRPTAPDDKSLTGEGSAVQRRQGRMNDILDRR